MTGLSITCGACQHSNANHQLWCVHCDAPLTEPLHRPKEFPDPQVRERSKFYARILQDLNERSSQDEIPKATFELISQFYKAQVSELDQLIAEHERGDRLSKMVSAARQSARDGMFQNAIAQLHRGQAEDPAAYRWHEMIAEITAKAEQSKQRQRAMLQANELFKEAKTCVAGTRLHEAAKKLEQAKELDPSHKQVAETLLQVNLQIEQQQALQLQETRQPETPVPLTGQNQDHDQSQDIATAEFAEEVKETKPQPALPQPFQATFAEDEEEILSPHHRWIETASHWSSMVRPFLLDNVGWFVGAFMVVAGFVVLIFSFWGTIEQNRILMHSLVFMALAVATGMFFSLAYFMRLKYPQLETSSNVLLVIVALLIPLVFAAAVLICLVPATSSETTLISGSNLSLAGILDHASLEQSTLDLGRQDELTP